MARAHPIATISHDDMILASSVEDGQVIDTDITNPPDLLQNDLRLLDRMDPMLKQFYRQYMQQLLHPLLPAGEVLLQPHVQKSLEDHFFDAGNPNFSSHYQATILDQVIRRIEAAVKNPEDEGVSDKLYECRAKLARSSKGDVIQKKKLSYYPPREFDEPAVSPIVIEEAKNIIGSGPNVGLRTWEAALHLACYLWEKPELIQGRKVLELGAGTGFLSIFCSTMLEARKVLATDGIFDVVRSLEHNIELNRTLHYRDNAPISQNMPTTIAMPIAQQLDWADEEAIDKILGIKDGVAETYYDIVLGADITYHPDACIALADILSKLATVNPSTEILISATERDVDTLQNFIDICRKQHNLSVQELELACPDIHEQKGFFHTIAMPTRIFSMRRESEMPGRA